MRALSTALFLIDLIHRRKSAFEDNLALGAIWSQPRFRRRLLVSSTLISAGRLT